MTMNRKNPAALGVGFPGGGAELGETVRQGALRELMEETGIRARAGELRPLGRQGFLGQYPDGSTFRAKYYALDRARRPQVLLSEEHSGSNWTPLTELQADPSRLQHQSARDALALLVAQRSKQAADVVRVVGSRPDNTFALSTVPRDIVNSDQRRCRCSWCCRSRRVNNGKKAGVQSVGNRRGRNRDRHGRRTSCAACLQRTTFFESL